MSLTPILIKDLRNCYQAKAPRAEDYLKLSLTERNELCKEVKQTLIDYVNSPKYQFSDIVRTKYETIKSNLY
jgi:hypothetical protein